MASIAAWHPWPGLFIAILAFIAAFVPFFRDFSTMKRGEKAIWTFLMLALVVLEIRSLKIAADDVEQDRRDQNDRAAKIADRIEKAIALGQQQFSATMSGINTTLQATRTTLENTRPRALLSFQQFAAPPLVTANVQIFFNITVANLGNDDALNSYRAAIPYVGQPENPNVERSLSKTFDEWWRVHRSGDKLLGVLPAGGRPFFTSEPVVVTPAERDAMRLRRTTIYLLNRIVWTDKTGRWVTDECIYYQDPNAGLGVTRYCEPEHRRQRYRATWQ